MNKSIIAVLLIVLAGVGLYLSTKSPSATENPNMTPTPVVLRASMVCDDNSHFIAEFAPQNTVTIIVDGATLATASRVDGDGQRFENDTHVYVFAGEEATVTDKAANTSTSCSQPEEPNNAPVNFGDAGEGGGSQADLSAAVSASIIGKWQSIEDGKFAREFKDGGVVVDTYTGSAPISGTFKVFTNDNPIAGLPFGLDEGVVYLQITQPGTQEEKYNFRVSKVTPEELELVYLDRGGLLQFRKVE